MRGFVPTLQQGVRAPSVWVVHKESKLNTEETTSVRQRGAHPVAIFIAVHIFAVGFIGIAAGTLGETYAPEDRGAAHYMRLVPLEEGAGRIVSPQTAATQNDSNS